MKRLSYTAWLAPLGFLMAILVFGCGGSGNTPYDPIISTNTTTSGGGPTTGGGTPDFALAPGSQMQTVQEYGGSLGAMMSKPNGLQNLHQWTFDLSAQSVNHFSGTVTLQTTNPNSEVFNTKLPASEPVSAGGTTPFQLIVGSNSNSLPLGDNIFTVTGTSGSLHHSSTCTVHVLNADFTLTPSNPTQTYVSGSSEQAPTFTFNLDANSVGNFTGPIALDVTKTANATNFTPSVPASVTISSAGAQTGFSLTVTTDTRFLPVGTYVFTVTGGAHGLSRLSHCTVIVTGST